jgi:hypothetical protein
MSIRELNEFICAPHDVPEDVATVCRADPSHQDNWHVLSMCAIMPRFCLHSPKHHSEATRCHSRSLQEERRADEWLSLPPKRARQAGPPGALRLHRRRRLPDLSLFQARGPYVHRARSNPLRPPLEAVTRPRQGVPRQHQQTRRSGSTQFAHARRHGTWRVLALLVVVF